METMLCLMYLWVFIELLLFIQCIRAVNRVAKKLENIDTTLIDLYQNLDEDLHNLYLVFKDK